MTGEQVARLILDANGLQSVPSTPCPASSATLRPALAQRQPLRAGLRRGDDQLDGGRRAEVGHAIQHAKSYVPIVRSALFPPTAFASNAWMPLIGGALLSAVGPDHRASFCSRPVLFQLVTLPVEFDASRRAADQL